MTEGRQDIVPPSSKEDMPDENTSVPKSGQTENTNAAPGADDRKGKSGEAPLQSDSLSGEYQNKSLVEVVKMHQEAMKKLGEQSAEVNRARQSEQQVEALLGSIYAEPERYKQVKQWLTEYTGQSDADKGLPAKKDGEKSQAPNSPRGDDDTRRLLQVQVVDDFYRRHGLDSLKPEERKEFVGKIFNEFADLVDPGGGKPIRQLLSEAALDKVPILLDKAYKIVSVDRARQEGKLEGLLSQAVNQEASIGAIRGGQNQERSKGLSADEKMIASKLGVSEEKYLKRREEIEKSKKPRNV